jgi:hypothetical protein
MENIPVKLNVIPPAYNFFEDNQVLTATQLNNAIRYFDYQDRLTRTRLTGVGIVCGLKAHFSDNTIIVTKGCGITTDGDLISLEQDRHYTLAMPFVDNKANYVRFKKTDGSQYALFELLEQDSETAENEKPLSAFFTNTSTPADYVVLLYLSQYLEDIDPCTSDDCDNKGVLQQSELKALLIGKADYELIKGSSQCCGDEYFDLPDAYVQRVLFNPANDILSLTGFKALYKSAVEESAKILDVALAKADTVADSLQQCFAAGGELPQPVSAGRPAPAPVTDRTPPTPGTTTRPAPATGATRPAATTIPVLARFSDLTVRLPASLLARFRAVAGNAGAAFKARVPVLLTQAMQDKGIQYLYDFVKDVAAAFQEFKEASFELCQGCCVPADLFPKHLALGLVQENAPTAACQYRQCFIESPILNRKDDQLRKALYLYNRLVQIIQNYEFNVPNADTVEIRVTPSVGTEKPLGEKSIPYYYRSNSLVEEWDYERYKRQATDTHLSYYGKEAAPADKPYVQRPLDFDLDKYGFFRIEGHIGKLYETAYTQLNQLRKEKDLPFDIMGLQLDRDRRFILPKWDFRIPHLEVLHEVTKFHFADYLDNLHGFNDQLEASLPPDTELEKPGYTEHYGNVKTIKATAVQKKKELNKQIEDTQPLLNLSFAELKTRDFTPLYANIASNASVVNKNASLLTRTALSTPLQSAAFVIQPQILDWIRDLARDSEEALKDSFVFSNFLKDNPALMHNAGVARGGTFILLYTLTTVNNTTQRIVVGDFYVPYIVQPVLEKPSIPLPPKPGIPRPRLPLDFDIKADVIKPPLYNEAVLTLGNQVKVNETVLKAYEVKFKDVDEQVNQARIEAINANSKVTNEMGKVVDNYQSSFNKIVDSYQSVLSRSTVDKGTVFEAADFGKLAATPERTKTLTREELVQMDKNMRDSITLLQKEHPDIAKDLFKFNK